ncbi:hypothetical protein Cs7R123_48930 [Catellatospora sp. TT07R-123]|nr:hypothetical protein Cs7R123_48930 [Catellatospora sp. TT07R-123]
MGGGGTGGIGVGIGDGPGGDGTGVGAGGGAGGSGAGTGGCMGSFGSVMFDMSASSGLPQPYPPDGRRQTGSDYAAWPDRSTAAPSR